MEEHITTPHPYDEEETENPSEHNKVNTVECEYCDFKIICGLFDHFGLKSKSELKTHIKEMHLIDIDENNDKNADNNVDDAKNDHRNYCNGDDAGNDDGGATGGNNCDDGYLEDCSGDGDCCLESWIGDGFEDCADQAYDCDLTCYDNDGGDCPGLGALMDDTDYIKDVSLVLTDYIDPELEHYMLQIKRLEVLPS